MINLQIPHANTVSSLRARIRGWRDEGLTVGFVPTMGALHSGHLSLVRLAKAQCDRVVTSIYVNPEQFAPGEDLAAYPRDPIDDADKLASVQCDLIYFPDDSVMYPDGFCSSTIVTGPALGLETDFRPHFFKGVATVVTKLFNQVRPDVAVFGEKDYQQLIVIRQLVKDLDFNIDILSGETERESDGLALSSRNAYLHADQRERAAQLNIVLAEFAASLTNGATISQARTVALQRLEAAFDSVDYIEARDANTLAELDSGKIQRPTRVLAAARIGKTRLIDNRAAGPGQGH
jgi:pantoate--beta-alanine ligase